MEALDSYHQEFFSDALVRADSNGEWMLATLFDMFAEAASDNGDVEALDYTPYRSSRAQIDGYHFDPELGVVTIAVADFRNEIELEKLNASEIQATFKKAENFVKQSFQSAFISDLEESSAGYQVAYFLFSQRKRINRIKFLLLSNAELVARIKGLESTQFENITLSYSVLDLSRYFDIQNSKTGNEPIEVDVLELGGEAIPFLPATYEEEEYQAYLLVIPGELLAKIYFEYGPRLLEQNVRSFLQARGKVNKGIQQTLNNEPQMFFAYNNGLTATASSVEVIKKPDGSSGIRSIKNLQIVNGGQTTASLLFARDRNKVDLRRVYIQVKLSVIPEERVEQVVPNISKFANTQNRVSDADFFSNHPFHVRVEGFSRRIFAPPKEGQFSQGKWFYERARGQYRDGQAYLTDAKRRAFLTEYPKTQMLTKTDLAKYEMSFEGEPHTVSLGAQKNFIAFAAKTSKIWEARESHYNETWYRDAIAKAIIFRELDKSIMRASWYEGGYKANIVTYSIAWLTEYLKIHKEAGIDFGKVWQLQTMPEGLRKVFDMVSEDISKAILKTPENVSNITEWCKRQACWHQIKSTATSASIDEKLIEGIIKSSEDRKQEGRDARKTQIIDNEVQAEIFVMNLGRKWEKIREYAMARTILTPQQDIAITNILRGRIPTEIQVKQLMRVVKRVQEEGMELK